MRLSFWALVFLRVCCCRAQCLRNVSIAPMTESDRKQRERAKFSVDSYLGAFRGVGACISDALSFLRSSLSVIIRRLLICENARQRERAKEVKNKRADDGAGTLIENVRRRCDETPELGPVIDEEPGDMSSSLLRFNVKLFNFGARWTRLLRIKNEEFRSSVFFFFNR